MSVLRDSSRARAPNTRRFGKDLYFETHEYIVDPRTTLRPHEYRPGTTTTTRERERGRRCRLGAAFEPWEVPLFGRTAGDTPVTVAICNSVGA